MTEQPTEAARVKVTVRDMPQFDDFRGYRWIECGNSPSGGIWGASVFPGRRNQIIEYCRTVVAGNPDQRRLMTRYPFDPEAMYFSADHPEGVPVEWEDVR